MTPPFAVSEGLHVKNRNKIIAASAGLAVSLAGLWYAISGGQEQRALQGAGVGSSAVHPARSGAAHLGAATDDSGSARTGQPRTDPSQRTSIGAPSEGHMLDADAGHDASFPLWRAGLQESLAR